MKTRNYMSALTTAHARYHRAQRGGNKRMVEYLEQNNYSNDSLLACCMVRRDNNKQLNKHIMATKNLLTSALGENILKGVHSRMYDNFCESLCASLASSASEGCGLGRFTYAALIATWRKDTANCAYLLNESEGRKLYAANPADPRLRRIGVEGHWSFFVSPSASEKETDSITVLVGSWLRSWTSWYDSVVCYGHYGKGGMPVASSVSVDLLNRCSSLWSTRGVGGRTAATTEEKQQKKVARAVAGLDVASLLAALRASGVDLSALAAAANNQD